MDSRILFLAAAILGVVSAAPMGMKNIHIIMNNSGLVWQDPDQMPLYEFYQNKVWGCGRGWSLLPWKKFTLSSEGQVFRGSCDTEFVLPRSVNCLNKICVKPETITIDRSGIEMMFTNVYKNETKRLTHTDKTMQSTCFTGNSIMVKLTTDRSVTLPSTDFQFKFEIYSECPGASKDLVMKSNEDSQELSNMNAFEEAVTKNLILGIVTAACICVVFIIIFFITYCYYKNNPDIGRHHYTEETKPLNK
ncbi:uncharacterized protein LOC134231441 [Saccostrea cucullata]|uniref:uncharacterized protein LOC134231441 n=1 Tax=Saccostrea cuccullata TaxID=36930 RepID=UPI002ED14F40